MKLTGLLLLGSALADVDFRMPALMAAKTAHREEMRAQGVFAKGIYEFVLGFQPCVDGKSGDYGCKGMDMHGFLSHEAMGSKVREGNDVWGWTSADGREFGAVGEADGTAFVEVKSDGSLEYVGRLPTQTKNSTWRDIKVISDHAYIGSEATGHGMQVFDMRKLLSIPSMARRRGVPIVFDISTDLTAWYSGFGSSHNMVAHPEENMIYAVGTSKTIAGCNGGLYMVDVSKPEKPTSPGCVGQDGYVHDAQCVVYSGPDTKYTGKTVCFGFDEDTLTIFDVTDKSSPKQISRTAYNGATYTHQGWLIDNTNMTYLLLDDEEDEIKRAGPAANNHTTTYIWSIESLEKPVKTGVYQSPVKSIDHNQYVVDGLSYMSNYGSGLRVVDVSSVTQDPTGKLFSEVAFFDVYPEDDAEGGVVDFNGSWSVYPFFKSGYILLNSIERGIYSLKLNR